MKPSYGLEEHEIAQMLASSYSHAAEDRDARMLVEQRVEAQGLVDAVTAALAQDSGLLNEAEAAQINQAIETLVTIARSDDTHAISDAVAALGRQTEVFAARRMDKSIRKALQGKSIEDVVDS